MQQFSKYHFVFYRNLYRYRSLIWELAKRDLISRYRGSVLGFAWSFLNPILLMIIYTLVFRSIGSFEIENYSLYVLIGVLTWNCISGSISESCYTIQGSLSLVSKTPLPAEVITAKTVLSQMMNMSFSIVIYILCSLLFYDKIVINWIHFPIAMVFLTVFLGSICFGLSVLSAIFKDLQQLVTNLLLALFFTAPVVYDFNALPKMVQKLLILNPLTQAVRLFQHLFFFDTIPPAEVFVSLGLYLLVFQVISVFVCQDLGPNLAEKV